MAIGLINENTLTSIAESIREKLGYSSIQMYPQEMPEYINSIMSQQTYRDINDVNFYDYDGTLLYSCTKAEMLEATTMPPLPGNKPNMQVEGWNWTLQEIQNELQQKPSMSGACACVNVGCTYHTIDNSIEITTIVKHGQNSIQLLTSAMTANDITIDWGDGDTTVRNTTNTAATLHTYANPPANTFYTIKIKSNSGNISMSTTRGICYGTANTATINSTYNARYCIFSIGLPKPQYLGGNNSAQPFSTAAFLGMSHLKTFSISSGLTSLPSQALRETSSLDHCNIPKPISVIPSSGFYYSFGMESISLPYGITTIGPGAFYFCTKLKSINLPSTLTSIGKQAFGYCRSLSSLVIPRQVTAITNTIATACPKLNDIYLTHYTPPTIPSSAVFGTFVNKIHVPYGTLNIYKNNWSAYTTAFTNKIVDDMFF